MSLLSDIENTLPDHYTLSNKKLIIIAQIRDETIYFYNELDPNTTIILLSQPKCYIIKQIFLEFMNNIGVTVIDIKNNESFDNNYRLDNRSIKIIMNLLNNYNYDKIITHPDTTNNPQNRELYKLIKKYMEINKTNNHYTYNISPNILLPCGIQKGILELYCKAQDKNGNLNISMYNNYANISSQISGLRKL